MTKKRRLFTYKQQLLSTLEACMRGHNKCRILRNNEEKYVYPKCCVENLVHLLEERIKRRESASYLLLTEQHPNQNRLNKSKSKIF